MDKKEDQKPYLADTVHKRLYELLEKLKKYYDVYLVCNQEQKDRLFKSSANLIQQLVDISEGFPERNKVFYETLLVYGLEFLVSEYGDEEERALGNFKWPLSFTGSREKDEMDAKGTVMWESNKGRLTPLINVANPSQSQLRARLGMKP